MFNISTSAVPTPATRTRRWAARLGALLMVAALAACGSSVKLDEAPVEDRNAAAGAATGAGTDGVDSRNVATVQVPGIDTPQPAGLARIVYFDYDSFEVRPEFTGALESNARYLKANPNRKVGLEGHTDERGGREYNLALGQKRAEAVRRSLALLGVSESQMEPVSFGEEKPAALGADEGSFAKNRRVELTYR